jgi:adenylate cyclase
MGFPDVPDDDVTFYDADLEAVQEFTGRVRSLWTPSYQDVYATRVVSSAMSRIAEVTTDGLVAAVDALRQEGVSDPEIAGACLDMLDVDAIERALGYVYRRQLRAALWRRLSDARSPGSETVLAVGFVDLVRFTALTEQVAEDQLQRLVDRFEELAHEAVTQHNGRVVEVATELVDVYASDELLPPARAGLAFGPVLARGGDYFGPVINLASRIVDVARPKSVVVSEELRAAVGDDERFSWRRLPAMRLKGIGSPPLWVLRRRRDHDDG